MALVYRHRRNDTSEVFYIGIGVSKYRSTDTHNRNKHWHNIVNKHGYTAEIILENISWEQAQQLEILLISQYGRIDTQNGSLVNMTDGGEGTSGAKLNKATRDKMSTYAKTRKWSVATLDKLRKSKIGNKNANGPKSEKQKRKQSETMKLKNSCFCYRYKKRLSLLGKSKSKEHCLNMSKPIAQYDTNGNVLNTFVSVKIANEITGIHLSCISACARGKQITAGGFKWVYPQF